MRCEWPAFTKGTPCIHCGFTLPRDYKSAPVALCGSQQQCRFLGSETGETVLIKCKTCKGNVRMKYAIHSCEIFGKCLPTQSGAVDDWHGCICCERRELIAD